MDWRYGGNGPIAAAAILCLGVLAGCNTVANSGPPTPVANGDVPIASAIDAPPGSNEDFILNVGRRVYFAEGSSALDGTAKATLDKQAAWLNQYPQYKVKIEGFADDPGSAEANRALGLKRAQAIQAYLVEKGVPAARIVRVKSFGNEPDRLTKRDCPDSACRAQNRHGTTVLQGGVES